MRGFQGEWFDKMLEPEMIGEILVDQRLINKSQLACALDIARERGKRLGEVLIDLSLVSEDQISYALEIQETRIR